tara:strand:- start:573 stop:719 length:147 start_codon:yes stop_codon:yes gene_type:complete
MPERPIWPWVNGPIRDLDRFSDKGAVAYADSDASVIQCPKKDALNGNV